MATATVDIAAFGNLNEDQLVNLSRVSEQAERYNDMCMFMGELVKRRAAANTDLQVEERNLLSVAFKNVVGSKRASWRTLAAQNFEDSEQPLVDSYRKLVEKELQDICAQVLELLEKSLLPTVEGSNSETEVFYLKMCGDYYRYLAEFDQESQHPAKAETFYSKALDSAKQNLNETHPTRLGLALNFSVCYYEILKNPEKACQLAKEAFDAAIEKLDTLNDTCYKDSTLIMQLLRDNLTLWTSEYQQDEQGNEPAEEE